MKFITLRSARFDISHAVENYESLRPGLGTKIFSELEEIADHIMRFPQGFVAASTVARCVNLQTIPFQLFYAVEEDAVIILGLLPSRMSPQKRKQLLAGRVNSGLTL